MTPQQLKNSILQQAIEGKLVEQRPEDGNGRDLLKAIQKEKAKLVQDKKIKKEKPLPEIKEEEISFEIPENWCWCRLDDAVVKEVKRGKSPTYAIDGTVMVFAQKCNTKYNGIDITLAKYLSDEVVNKYPDSEYMQDKDIVINSTGTGTMGRVGIYIVEKDNKSAVPLVPDSHVTVIRISNNMDAQYVYTVLKSQQSYFESQGDGSTKQKELKAAVIKSLLIPLPPLGEQKRIVARLAEILPQVEIYAQAYQELQELNSKFPGQLKNSLLQKAIEGKLVEQRPEEGNGRDLLKAIKKEKAQLVQAKKIKKEKPLPEIVEEEIPFEIPENWCWCRLDDVVVKEVKRGKSPTYAIDGTVMVFAQKCNTKYNGIDITLAKYLSDEVVNKYPDSEYMQDKDIVINSTGTGTMGRVGIYIVEKDNKSAVPLVPDSHVTVIRISNNMDAQYVYTVLKSQQSYFESQGDGSTKQKELKAAVIKSLLIPLPPLAEQKRIVAKLEQLLQLCQQLV